MTRWKNENAYEDAIAAAHRAFRFIPVNVIKAAIATESSFDDRAYLEEAGGDGSVGLMQIRPSTAATVGYHGTKANLFLPAVNVYYGTAFLAKLAKIVPMIRTASGDNYDYLAMVSAYNGGYRPSLGFGARVTKPTTVCLRRDPVTKNCTRTFTAQPGEFGNQEHVDRFRAAWQYFGGEQTDKPGTLPLVLIAAGLLGFALLKAKGGLSWT